MRPSPRRDAFGCEKPVIPQTPRARRPPVQAYCCDDTASHVSAAFGHRPSINRRISANNCRRIASSASWKVTYRPCRTTLAPILTNFSRSVVSHQRSVWAREVNFCCWLQADYLITSAPRPVYPQLRTFKPHVCFRADCVRSTPSSGRGRHPRPTSQFDPTRTLVPIRIVGRRCRFVLKSG